MGKTRINKMGHRSSHARLSTLGKTRIDYCELEEHAPANPPILPPAGSHPRDPLVPLLPDLSPTACAGPYSILL
jgi:hypothetical protein